ncbi:MAG: hypothetical protein J6V60_05280 [Muribaculaceae bacterium]|nr:hypothetical protein [Muribaculaceae bacterium]
MPNITPAMQLAAEADVFVVIGTSLAVYPAAGLMSCVAKGTPIYYIDPNPASTGGVANVTVIREKASVGMKKLVDILHSKLG